MDKSKNKKPKHVVWFMCDQLRADCLGFMGNDIVHTPNLDKLANDGHIFQNMFVQFPTCMASRSSMLTGRYPSTIRMANGSPFLDPRETTLPEILQRRGWNTGMFGKLHITPQCYTADVLKSDYPISDWRKFIKDSCLSPIPDDPMKRNYGFSHLREVEDRLWGGYLDWMRKKDSKTSDEIISRLIPFSGKYFDDDFPGMAPIRVGKSIIPSELHNSTFIAESAADWFTSEHENNSCFMQVSFVDPHPPWDPPADIASLYNPEDIPLPKYRDIGNLKWPSVLVERGFDQAWRNVSPEMARTTLAYYYAMIDLIDRSIGKVVSAIEAAGELDDTLFIFAADHGEHCGNYGLYRKGHFHYDHLIRTPFFASWKNGWSGGDCNNKLWQAIDIAPSILDILNIDPDPGMQGISFLPGLLEDEKMLGREWITSQSRNGASGPFVDILTVRTKDEKLNYFPGENMGHLFDLKNDPDERCDLSDSDAGRKPYRNMMHLLNDAIYSQRDPLPVPLSQY